MLEMAKVKKDDIVYDLGCGDCRIPVTAAKKFGCKAYGYDIDPARIKDSLENIKKNKVEDLVEVKKQDIFAKDFDISKATVVTSLPADISCAGAPGTGILRPFLILICINFVVVYGKMRCSLRPAEASADVPGTGFSGSVNCDDMPDPELWLAG